MYRRYNYQRFVLILVLVESGLGEGQKKCTIFGNAEVLILVLVESGLGVEFYSPDSTIHLMS